MLAGACLKLGIVAALEALPARPGLLVLTYHRVGDASGCCYDRGVFSASASEFDNQLTHLKRVFHMATLEEVLWLAAHPEKFRRPELLITFDDGYRDCYDTAFPVLKSHGVQATFFLVSSFVGTDHLPWWDTIAYIVRNTRQSTISLRRPYPVSFTIDGSADAVLVNVLRLYKSPATTDPELFIADLSEACEVDAPAGAAERVFLDWNQSREMLAGGMAFGSHTHSHRLLGKLPPKEQMDELATSRAILCRELGTKPQSVAFPVGSRDAFTAETMAAAREAGYQVAFSHYGGFNHSGRFNTHDVRRISVRPYDSRARFRMRTALLPRFGIEL